MSSLFLRVFDNDRVTCHTGANDVPSDVGDAYRQREGYPRSFIMNNL